jgi:hypothetical protein
VEQQLQQCKETVLLLDIGVLEEDYSYEWASPTFAIPKKNGTIRVVTNFRKLNLLLKPLPFRFPHIGDMIRSMEGFTFPSVLDLNMGSFLLSHQIRYCWCLKSMQNFFPMGKIQIQTLTHGYQDCLVPDAFQNVMSKLVQEMEYFGSNLRS